MKKLFNQGKRGLLLLIWAMTASNLYAEDVEYIMYVNLTDGTNVQFVLPEEKPFVGCYDGKMTISYGSHFTMVDSTETSWYSVRDNIVLERSQVKDLTFGVATEIKNVNSDNHRIAFDLSQSNYIRISGLESKDHVEVFSLDGKKVLVPTKIQDSEAVVDLSGRRRGIYMVSVNRSFTFKIMKP